MSRGFRAAAAGLGILTVVLFGQASAQTTNRTPKFSPVPDIADGNCTFSQSNPDNSIKNLTLQTKDAEFLGEEVHRGEALVDFGRYKAILIFGPDSLSIPFGKDSKLIIPGGEDVIVPQGQDTKGVSAVQLALDIVQIRPQMPRLANACNQALHARI